MRIIAGNARGRRIEAPPGRSTRPTLDRVRENLFNMIQGEVAGRNVLDLFAGSGALSFEAISRGAAFAVMADHDPAACIIQRENAEGLHFDDRVRIIRSDWKRAVCLLESEGLSFDLVFLDPPYHTTQLEEIMSVINPILAHDALIILEHESGKALPCFPAFRTVKERAWGYCAVSIFRPARAHAEPKEE